MRTKKQIVVALALASLALPLAPSAAGAPPREPAARPTYSEFTYERTYVSMRDGVELAVDIWRPVTPKAVEVPVILSLTPYHSLYVALDPREEDLPAGDAALFVPKGYAYARADVRGTYNSGGCWDYGGVKERHDGYDLVEWFGTRGWSNGKVAMTGGSYDGTTANAAAVEDPPHLATIVPVSAISRWWGYAYQQGTRSSYSGESLDIDPPSDTPTDFMFAYGFLPPPDPASMSRADQIAMRWEPCGRVQKLARGYDPQPTYDSFWKQRDYLMRADEVDVPVLVAHGLLDFNVKTWEGTQWFDALKTEKAMWLGQWPHANPRSYDPGWDLFLERWFERWLYGVENGVEDEPAVHVQTNDGKWHDMERWGSPREISVPLGEGTWEFFDDGLLIESEMLRGPESDRFLRIELPGTSGIRIQGRPVLRLAASSDAPGTHFVATLCDVGPSGGCQVISRAFMNARYRNGLGRGHDLQPDKVYMLDLSFIDKDHVIADDHHLELFIASSSNSWVFPNEVRATNTIDLRRSSLRLPVLD
ncbi:MAG: CocE/NonD family hydrolase [Actinomycetota bacterium]